jgi:hypothetical protein
MFDASNCRADEAATEAMLRAESLGGLRLGLPEKDVLKLLGRPATRGKLFCPFSKSYSCSCSCSCSILKYGPRFGRLSKAEKHASPVGVPGSGRKLRAGLALFRQGHRTFDERRREKVRGKDDRQHYRIRAVHFATRKGIKMGTRRAPRVRLTPSMSIGKQGPIPASLSWVPSTAASSSISTRAR